MALRKRNRKRLKCAGVGIALLAGLAFGAQTITPVPVGFSSDVVDIGVVVSDLEKSAEFYTQVIGMKEEQPFSVDGQVAFGAGLTDGQGIKVRVFKIGGAIKATKLKLMQFPKGTSKPSDNKFIHSQLGFSYLTFHTQSTARSVARADQFGVKPIKGEPYELPRQGSAKPTFLTLLRDPDGNLVELVGPR